MASRTSRFDRGHSWEQLAQLLPAALRSGVSALVFGHPGVGKSALAARLASDFDLPLVDIRLAQQEPGDLAGVYFPDAERSRLTLVPPDWVRELVDRPAFLFLDEINAAVSRLHQSVAYQMVLERRLGPFCFHPDTVVLAAGNLDEDDALATPLSSALANRFAHFRLAVDSGAWLNWAREQELSDEIVAYVARHGDPVLYSREPGQTLFPSPRSWAMASQLMKELPRSLHQDGTSACVGVAAARKLQSFLKLYRRVHPERILRKGKAMDFRSGPQSEPSFLHAAVYSVADWLRNEGSLEESELPNVVAFLNSPGLDPEYRVLFLRQVKARRKLLARLKALPEFRDLARGLVDIHAGLYQ